MEFSSLNLHSDLQRGLADAGYINCMPVQEQVLAYAFDGQDLYVQSQTGTGKTAAFLVVIFQRLLSEPLLGGKKALIMVPTRELAVQVEEEAKVLSRHLPFKTGCFYGGVGYGQQQQLLKDNVQILVGTPGRVLDLNKSGQMNLMDTAFLILDEADRMFDMGFYPDLRKLIKVVPPVDRRQTMLFSATLNSWVKNLAWEYTKNPRSIEIEPETVTVEEIDQLLYHVHSEDKMKLLLGILERERPESAIIFCNTKRYAEIIAKRLRINGINCEFIIGDLPQSKRLKIIEDVKSGLVKMLVATDVAARGLDVEALALVVNYDLPVEAENYVHRIGRTARAGKTGRAVTFASEQDVYELADIERYIGKKIPSEVAGEELFAADKSEGQRVHTDIYDDRDRGRGGRERSGGRDGRGGYAAGRENRSGRGRAGTGRDAPRRERDGGGRESPRGESLRPRREEAGGAEDAKLAALPFEERMAHYRKKYRTGESPSRESPASAASGIENGTRNAGGRPSDARKQDGRGEQRRKRGGKRQRGRSPEGKTRSAADGNKAAAVQNNTQPESRGGILSRFLGIFTKRGKPQDK